MKAVRRLFLLLVCSVYAVSAAFKKKMPSPDSWGPSGTDNNTTQQLLTNHLLSRFIVVPEHKMIFCYIEKVACTQFNHLFNTITGAKSIYLDWKWYRNSLKAVGWSKQQLEDAIVNPAWHKAVFYREPMERFLSGYRSKCEEGHDSDGPNHCRPFFGKRFPTFPEAVNAVARMDQQMSDAEQMDQKSDVHWTRQTKFCGGLDRTLQYYDTVVQVDHHTAREEVQKMLNKSGIESSDLPLFDKLFPKGTVGNTGLNKGHVTAADAHMLEYYNTPDLTNTILEHYMEDYVLFGIRAPPWAVTALEHRKKLADREALTD